ncbi:hypothetical protein VULLAG_LOCUS5927 [Vulpes lagopus]
MGCRPGLGGMARIRVGGEGSRPRRGPGPGEAGRQGTPGLCAVVLGAGARCGEGPWGGGSGTPGRSAPSSSLSFPLSSSPPGVGTPLQVHLPGSGSTTLRSARSLLPGTGSPGPTGLGTNSAGLLVHLWKTQREDVMRVER